MSVVILDWPDGMTESIVAEVMDVCGVDEGTAEQAVEVVSARVAEAITGGVLAIVSREDGAGDD